LGSEQLRFVRSSQWPGVFDRGVGNVLPSARNVKPSGGLNIQGEVVVREARVGFTQLAIEHLHERNMRALLVHQNIPGQFRYLASALARIAILASHADLRAVAGASLNIAFVVGAQLGA